MMNWIKIEVIFLFIIIIICSNEQEASLNLINNSTSEKNVSIIMEKELEYLDQKITSVFMKLKKVSMKLIRLNYNFMLIIEKEFKLFFPFNYIVIFICLIFLFLKMKQTLLKCFNSNSHMSEILKTINYNKILEQLNSINLDLAQIMKNKPLVKENSNIELNILKEQLEKILDSQIESLTIVHKISSESLNQ